MSSADPPDDAGHSDDAGRSDGGARSDGGGHPPGTVRPDGVDQPGHVDPSPEIDAGARALAGTTALVFAGLMHLMVGGFVALSGRLAPAWAVAALAAIWAVVAVVIWRWHRRRPLATLLLPFVAAGVLWGALWVGQRYLDWGA